MLASALTFNNFIIRFPIKNRKSYNKLDSIKLEALIVYFFLTYLVCNINNKAHCEEASYFFCWGQKEIQNLVSYTTQPGFLVSVSHQIIICHECPISEPNSCPKNHVLSSSSFQWHKLRGWSKITISQTVLQAKWKELIKISKCLSYTDRI